MCSVNIYIYIVVGIVFLNVIPQFLLKKMARSQRLLRNSTFLSALRHVLLWYALVKCMPVVHSYLRIDKLLGLPGSHILFVALSLIGNLQVLCLAHVFIYVCSLAIVFLDIFPLQVLSSYVLVLLRFPNIDICVAHCQYWGLAN